jgi:hypothetical protein
VPYLSVCAIYRDEAPYLREWIEFHRLVGAERFYLYDNRSRDAHGEALAPYVSEGIVDVRDWPPVPGMISAYDHCIEHRREESRWIAFIDVDEFLFSPTGKTVSELLVEYEDAPGVGVNRATFGTSGHRVAPPGLVIESYVRRGPQSLNTNHGIKSIVNPRLVERCMGAHFFHYRTGAAVDENHRPVPSGRTQSVSLSRLRINHYWLKSEAEFREKWEKKPRPQTGRPRSERVPHRQAALAAAGARPRTVPKGPPRSEEVRPDFERLDKKFNAERDEAILPYVPAVRAALAARAGRSEPPAGDPG